MCVHVLHMHSHILADFVWPRRPKLATLASQHDSAIGNDKLRMARAVTRTTSTKPLFETEGAAEPVDRFFHVFVDQNRYDCRSRSRSVDDHAYPQSQNDRQGRCYTKSQRESGHYQRAGIILVVRANVISSPVRLGLPQTRVSCRAEQPFPFMPARSRTWCKE